MAVDVLQSIDYRLSAVWTVVVHHHYLEVEFTARIVLFNGLSGSVCTGQAKRPGAYLASKVRTNSQVTSAMFSRSLYVGSNTEYLCDAGVLAIT